MNDNFIQLQKHADDFANFNVLYFFVPIALLFIILIWMFVGFKYMAWPLGIFLSMFVIVVLFAFSASYRIHSKAYNQERFLPLQQQAQNTQQAYENSIAYMPQALFAVACALTCEGTTGCWQCNSPSPSPIPNNGPNAPIGPGQVRNASSIYENSCTKTYPTANTSTSTHRTPISTSETTNSKSLESSIMRSRASLNLIDNSTSEQRRVVDGISDASVEDIATL